MIPTSGKTNKIISSFFSGTSGVTVPLANKQLYPEEFQSKSRLSYYGSLFNSIEINSSFYKIPMASTIRKWSESVPEDFRFTFKLWRDITHTKELVFKNEDIHHFIQNIAEVGSKKGCLLIQFPPSLTINYTSQLFNLLDRIIQADPERSWQIALEFRNSSWYTEETIRLLNDFQAGMVLHDKLSEANTHEPISETFVYVRFHGPGGNYKGSYEDDFLNEYSQYVREWLGEGKDVYVYFNNTRGDAVQNLMTLNNLLRL